MIIAIVIENQLKMTVGDCLSDASVFLIYDSDKKIKQIIPLPICEPQLMKAICFSKYLKDHLVEIVFARDLGPKAKSYLNDLLIRYSSSIDYDSAENVISNINKNKIR
ncbi:MULTISPECIES: hypothetical protein [unclassified Lentimicrobium]|uniref:hypothetical protein n=1 Tax=unclassified Lentimicrobium TaxID=2677434 RepID=UPI001556C021|nr:MULTISPECIES: hypothetical protein [unclassified Lentimicrobium]NPD45069.1 hypothetical protein [Lentimicrobium sp. S6]NPD84533.1 hypothetical protein [Lentimicrobium sp. L6]